MNTALLALLRNDLRLFFSDRRAVIITILVPVAIASFFGAILSGGGGGQPQGKLTLLVSDSDHSPLSTEIVANLKKDPALSVSEAPPPEAARDAVKSGKTPVALFLPPGLGAQATQAMFAGPNAPRPRVSLVYDPSDAAEYQMARGLVMQQVLQVVSRRAFSADSAATVDQTLAALQANRDMAPDERAALTDLLGGVKRYYGRPGADGADGAGGGPSIGMPVDFADEASATGEKDAARAATVGHAFTGMAIQGVLFFAIDAAMGILRDRRNGLWKRLRAAPLSRPTLLGAKLAGTALIALLILGIVFGAGALLFRIRITGSPLGFALLCLCTALMVSAFGPLIAALGRTEQQSRGYAIPAVLGMSLLGGAWFPAFLMPAWIQPVSKAMPSRWAADGFDAMLWRGFGLPAALVPCAVLLGFAAVFAAFAFARFHWEAE